MSLTPVTILPGRKAVQLDLFEVAPMVRVTVPKPANVNNPPRVGVVILQPTGDGKTFTPMIETHPACVNLKDWDEKLYGCTRFVIAALVAAGFVEGERIAPRSMTINLDSWFTHREAMRANPYFWQDSDNRARYAKAFERVKQQLDREREDGAGDPESIRNPQSAIRNPRPSRKVTSAAAPSSPATPPSAVLTPEPPQTPRRGSAGAE